MTWNKKPFSIYDSEEKTTLKLIKELGEQTNFNTQSLDQKTDLHGDHKGTWQGLSKPTLSDEGMRATVEDINEKQIPSIKEETKKLYNNSIIYISDYKRLPGESNDYKRLMRAYKDTKLNIVIDENIDLGMNDFIIDKQIVLNGYGKTISNTEIRVKSSFCTLSNFKLDCNKTNGIRINEISVSNTVLERIQVINAVEHSFLFESYKGTIYNTIVKDCISQDSIHGFISKATETKFVNCKASSHSSYAFGIISDDIQDNTAYAISNSITNCFAEDSAMGLILYARKKNSASNLPKNENHLINGFKTNRVTTPLSFGEFNIPVGYIGIEPIKNISVSNCSFKNSGTFVVELKNIQDSTFSNIQGVEPYYIHNTIAIDTASSFVSACERKNYESLVNIGNNEKCNCYVNRIFDVRHNATTENKIRLEGHLIKGMEITIYVRGMGGSMTFGGFDTDIFVTKDLNIPTTLNYNEVLVTKWVYSGITNKFINVVCSKVAYLN